jgi:hypothetical protein
MGEKSTNLRGVVRDGVVVFPDGTRLPDGVEVEVVLPPLPPEWEEEMKAWEKLSDEAWSMIDWGEGEIARDAG